ncbi:MAG: flavin reductase family protein [Dermatophilus congolensis]|nr:flavin reductase family protein [Dermatophilus congolensis]
MSIDNTTAAQTRLEPMEHGDPMDDPRAFRRALGQYATGVTVITTVNGDQKVGMAANSFSALSLDPPLILWSIRKESRSVEPFTTNGHFAVSVLAEQQVDVAGVFGHHRDDKFEQVTWTTSAQGDPLIDGALAHIECDTHQVIEGGDHLLLVGRVTRFARFPGHPLLFAQGRYGVAENHPGPDESNVHISTGGLEDEPDLLPSLIKAADRHLSVLFEKNRSKIGVTVNSGRVLNMLAGGAKSFERMAQESLLGDHALEEALAALLRDDSIVEVSERTWELTGRGGEVRASLRRNAEEFTQRQLRSIPEEDLAVAERVLRRLVTAVY